MCKYKHACMNCGNDFENYFENANFCCKKCYHEYRRKNSNLKVVQCPICKKMFLQKRPEQIFCSVDCRAKSTESRVQCVCEYCGETFHRKKSEVDYNKHHYCSIECRNAAMYWSDDDTKILMSCYGKMPYKEMVNLFSAPKTIDEIKRRAIYIGITSSREWTSEEINILINNYSIKPMHDVMELLPNRSQSSILGQAKTQNLKSYFYLNHIYTKDEDEYLTNNYLSKSDAELGEYLNRSPSGVAQHLLVLGLRRPKSISSYSDLSQYIRCRLSPWKDSIRISNNYTCALTGVRTNIIVHHIRGFNLLLNETIDTLDFPIYAHMSEYNQQQLDELLDMFLQIQDIYQAYICINEDIHKQFHHLYGYGNNTQEQWDDFVNKYYK